MTDLMVLPKPPEVPSKWDIIPIHASDIGSYKRCRRYWDWTSPARHNLRHKVHVFGINDKLWFGTGIHYALEKYYNPALQRDPVETFSSWFQLQWHGGLVAEDEVDLSYDLAPSYLPDESMYRVRGLSELLPDDRSEEMESYRELGIGMMTFYRDYAKRNDDFKVCAAESQFSIPLGFTSKDMREDSPNYGEMLEVHARGKRDAIVFRYDVERYAIIDHKTASAIGEDYFKKLDKDPQSTTYLWASQKEAELNDLPWVDIEDVIYQALRKVSPKPPTPLKDGHPSLNRTEESTTAQMFEDFVRQHDYLLWFKENPKAQAYYHYLLDEGDKLFIQRETTMRNKHEIEAQDLHVKMVAEEMLSDPNIYPNPTGDWLCVGCQFRNPCIAIDDGSDWKAMLVDGYEKNRDR